MKQLIQALLEFFYPLFKRFMSFSVYAYLSLGAVNTALNILIFALFYRLLSSQSEYELIGFSLKSYTISLLAAFVLTVPSGYWLAKNFAFNTTTQTNPSRSFVKYTMVVLQGLLSDYLIMKILIEFAQVHPTAAKVASTVIVLTLNYLLQKHFTFKADTGRKKP